MVYIVDYKTQYTASADSLGFVVEEPPLAGVKSGDLLLMMWGANTDAEIEILDGFDLASHITSAEAIGSTSFTVGASNIFFQDGDVLQIGDEKVLITGGAGDNTFNVSRSYGGTTAVAHAEDTNIWKTDSSSAWKPVPKGCSTMDVCEAKMYYKWATGADEQVSKWTVPIISTYVYMLTACIRGVHPTNPFADAGVSAYKSGSNTLVSYPDLTATGADQLALYVGASDGDNITQGAHGNAALWIGDDALVYQKISSGAGSMGAFADSVLSDQTVAIGVLLNDDPSNTIVPLQIAPSSSLTQIVADDNNDDGWMEAIYASGTDPKTGLARDVITPSCEVVIIGTSPTWIFRIDNGGTDWQDNGIVGENVTFAGGDTGVFEEVRQYQSSGGGRAYILISSYTGSGEPDNSSITGDTSGATALMYGTGSTHTDVTNCFRTNADVNLPNYRTYKINGMTSLGVANGIYFIEATGANSANELGRWYRLIEHDEVRSDGAQASLTVGTVSPTLSPYNMLNRTYTYVSGGDNRQPSLASGVQSGWKTNYLGSFKAFTTPVDYSDTPIAIWTRSGHTNVAKTFFCVIDDSNNWKIWRISNNKAANYQVVAPEYAVFDMNSTDTPAYQTASFDSSNIKYIGLMTMATSDIGRYGLYMYDQYTLGLQTIRGGGDSFGVPMTDVEKFLSIEETLNGQNFVEGLKAYTPTMFVVSKTIRFSCYMGVINQALGFPPQANGITDFMYNADGDSDLFGIDLTDAKGKINTALLLSDKGNLISTGGTSPVDMTGSTLVRYKPTFQEGETVTQVSFVDCEQITGGATLTNCTITGYTGTDGAILLTAT